MRKTSTPSTLGIHVLFYGNAWKNRSKALQSIESAKGKIECRECWKRDVEVKTNISSSRMNANNRIMTSFLSNSKACFREFSE